jgi:hypothetical protein
MRNLFLLIACFGLSFTQAQDNSSLSFQGEMGVFNTALHASHILHSGGYWTDYNKEELLDLLERQNYLSYEGGNSFTYQDKKGWSLSYKHHHALYSAVSKDLFRLGLYGNAPFAGDSLDLSFGLDYYRYSEIALSHQWSERFSSSISLLSGHQFLSVEARQADFYTAEHGAQIDYRLELELHFSDSTLAEPLEMNGKGLSLGFSYHDQLDDKEWGISISDIGFIQWDEECTNFGIDSSYSFSGLSVDNLLDFNNDIVEEEIDRWENSLKEPIQESYNWLLPARFNAWYKQDLKGYFNSLSTQLDYRARYYPSPRIAVNLHRLKGKRHWSIGYHSGGIEKGGFQASYGWEWKSTALHFYSKQANYLFSDQVYGAHIGFRLKKVFLPKN